MIIRNIVAFLLALAPSVALAQSSPGLRTGQVPTAAQWNSYFAGKVDYIPGFVPLTQAGVQANSPIVATLIGNAVSLSCPSCGTGPTTATNNAFARFNGTGGKTLKDSPLFIGTDDGHLTSTPILVSNDTEWGVGIFTTIANNASANAYEKIGLFVETITQDISDGAIFKDAVGADLRATISATNTQGRAFGATTNAKVLPGGDGQLISLETDIGDSSGNPAPGYPSTTLPNFQKIGINIYLSDGEATAGIFLNPAGGTAFHNGIYAAASAFPTLNVDSFLYLDTALGAGTYLFKVEGSTGRVSTRDYFVSANASPGYGYLLGSTGSDFGTITTVGVDQWSIGYSADLNTFGNSLLWDGAGNVVLNDGAIATNATDGFLYIATSAGPPTGTPTTYTGRVALVYDTSSHQFWIFDGSWKQPKTPSAAAIVTWQ